MAQQLLDGAYVVAVLQQVGGERVRKVRHVAGLAIPALRTASFTAR